MSYTFSTTLDASIDAAERRVRQALEAEGMGVLTEIDVEATFKKKLGLDDHRPYRILGACRPPLARRAIEAEPEIGALMPCNVVLQERGGQTQVSAVDPTASMQAVENNDALAEVARDARSRMQGVIDRLEKATSVEAQ
jgi:uncharacterized protein (DUF302 family)